MHSLTSKYSQVGVLDEDPNVLTRRLLGEVGPEVLDHLLATGPNQRVVVPGGPLQ